MKRSDISWCDFSGQNLNFLSGCTPASEGCKNCYAKAIYQRFNRDFSVTEHPDKLERLATQIFPQDGNVRGPHSKPICFVCDTGDLFHEKVSEHFITQALTMMWQRQNVTWVVLTKRAKRMADITWEYASHKGTFGENIWFGTTTENQKRLIERLPDLLRVPSNNRFLSVEPMLGPINTDDPELWLKTKSFLNGISWVICGGESGPCRRPFEKQWAKELYLQCQDANVPFYFKQGSGLRQGQDNTLDGVLVRQWMR